MEKVFRGNQANITYVLSEGCVDCRQDVLVRVGDGGDREVPPRQADAASTDQPAAPSSKISAGEPRP